jgi:GNAT superfamily N-acetyltransferase
MSIEIDVLNGDASWPQAEPLIQAVWPRACGRKIVVGSRQMGPRRSARADRRTGGLAQAGACLPCRHLLPRRDWDGRKVEIGGIGGVSTRQDCRGRGYATLALNAAIRTMRDHEAIRFAMLFCEPHNEAFYQARGWHPFKGEVYAEQPGEGFASRRWRRCVRFHPQAARRNNRPMRPAVVTPAAARVACAGAADNMSAIIYSIWMTCDV